MRHQHSGEPDIQRVSTRERTELQAGWGPRAWLQCPLVAEARAAKHEAEGQIHR